MRECVKKLQLHSSADQWRGWENLKIGGQIIFCEICKAIRSAEIVVANITTLNFNVLFELGYAIGLGKAVLPVRDTSYERDSKLFDEIGIFDTLGYNNFASSNELLSIVTKSETYTPPIYLIPETNKKQPIYYIKSPIDTDGSIRLTSSLKKCAFRFRTFDVKEIPRLSLHEAYKQTLSSVAVVAHLMDSRRTGADSHNARAAFVCGIAMAAQKIVLMLQEGVESQPIDYRDVVISYIDPTSIANNIEGVVRSTADRLESIDVTSVSLPRGLLERIDIGDVAAENEISALAHYFVKTPQFQQVRQGHARIVVGRKGTGKTALFYGIRGQFRPRKDRIVVDLKPEGHQFIRLREMVLSKLSSGMQQHTLTAFWHYLLLLEIVGKLIDRQAATAWRDQESLEKFRELSDLYKEYGAIEGDFSERLMSLVDSLIQRFPSTSNGNLKASDITDAIYSVDIRKLNSIVVDNLKRTSGAWILFDNIDKGFPSHGLTAEDIMIVKCLLEATRKIQNSLQTQDIECATTIFIRRDVFDHLIDDTPDRGKEPAANLDWSDVELIKELLAKRLSHEVQELKGDFDDVWSKVFDPHVGGESSFAYITARTFLRPRDILNFVRKAIQIAVSRGHQRVEQEDILIAEKEFSEDMLNELRYEMRDVYPELPNMITAFLNISGKLSKEDIDIILAEAGVQEKDRKEVYDVLLWFSFLGVSDTEDEYYSYQMHYNTSKLTSIIKDRKSSDRVMVIHPAFRKALEV